MSMIEELLEALKRQRNVLERWILTTTNRSPMLDSELIDIDKLITRAQASLVEPSTNAIEEAVRKERAFWADIYNVAVMGDGCLPGHQMRLAKAWLESPLIDTPETEASGGKG